MQSGSHKTASCNRTTLFENYLREQFPVIRNQIEIDETYAVYKRINSTQNGGGSRLTDTVIDIPASKPESRVTILYQTSKRSGRQLDPRQSPRISIQRSYIEELEKLVKRSKQSQDRHLECKINVTSTKTASNLNHPDASTAG